MCVLVCGLRCVCCVLFWCSLFVVMGWSLFVVARCVLIDVRCGLLLVVAKCRLLLCVVYLLFLGVAFCF